MQGVSSYQQEPARFERFAGWALGLGLFGPLTLLALFLREVCFGMGGVHGNAQLVMALSIHVATLVASVLGVISLKRIRREPGLRGKGLAAVSLIVAVPQLLFLIYADLHPSVF